MVSPEGVVLAAGLASRAGGEKLTLRLGDVTVIEWCLAGMAPVCSRITVVAGHRSERLSFLENGHPQVRLLGNPDYRQGMFSSVRLGLRQTQAERVFVTPGDYPFIDGAVYRRLLAFSGDIVLPVYHGRTGHPILLSRNSVREVLENPAYKTLRDLVAARGFTPVNVETGGVLFDIDTLTDYRRALELCPHFDLGGEVVKPEASRW